MVRACWRESPSTPALRPKTYSASGLVTPNTPINLTRYSRLRRPPRAGYGQRYAPAAYPRHRVHAWRSLVVARVRARGGGGRMRSCRAAAPRALWLAARARRRPAPSTSTRCGAAVGASESRRGARGLEHRAFLTVADGCLPGSARGLQRAVALWFVQAGSASSSMRPAPASSSLLWASHNPRINRTAHSRLRRLRSAGYAQRSAS